MIKGMLGFSGWSNGPAIGRVRLMGKGLLPYNNVAQTSTNLSIVADSGRKWLRHTGYSNPYLQVRLGELGFTEEEISTKRLFFGYRMKVSNSITSASVGRLVTGNNHTFVNTNSYQAEHEYFIEGMIDVANGVIQSWIDGDEYRTLPISVGATTPTSYLLQFGPYSGFSASNQVFYDDFYWLVDTSDVDDTPSNRLGPVRVGHINVNVDEMPEGWSTRPEDLNPEDILKTSSLLQTAVSETTPVVRTHENQSVATLGMKTPEIDNPILAVSATLFGYRDPGTSTTLSSQLVQGTTELPAQEHHLNTNLPKGGTDTNTLGCFNRDLNGERWTKQALDELKVRLHSN